MSEEFKKLCYFLKLDKKALGINKNIPSIVGDDIWKFQIFLRTSEYFERKGKFYLPARLLVKYLKYRKGIRLGFSIPNHTIGPGLRIAHYGTIVINSRSRIGKNATLHVGVNIGSNKGSKKAPQLGDNIYIGPGAKIFGDINIGDGVTIGANSVVNKDINEVGVTVVGVPARVLYPKVDINND